MYIAPSVPTRDSGTATAGIMVAYKVRRNRNITNHYQHNRRPQFQNGEQSITDASIAVVRSVITVTVIPFGRFASSCGKSRLILFTTMIVLPPGCRCTAFKMIAGNIGFALVRAIARESRPTQPACCSSTRPRRWRHRSALRAPHRGTRRPRPCSPGSSPIGRWSQSDNPGAVRRNSPWPH